MEPETQGGNERVYAKNVACVNAPLASAFLSPKRNSLMQNWPLKSDV
jgi:hypothetical protein